MISFRKSFQKKIFSTIICLCMICGLVWLAGMQANADSVPADFSFNVALADSSTYRYYDGGDTNGTLSISSMDNGSGSYNEGTINATNSGSSSTIYLKESKNFKNAEYILVPFTVSVKVPAYTAYTVDTRIQLSMNRNAKGSSWYVFEWADNTNDAAYTKSFSTKMDLTTTDGFVYRAYGNDKTYNPTEEGTLVFDNRAGSTATTITRQYAIFVGNSRSASLLKSYHHQLETSLTLTPTSVTATKVITYYNENTLVGSQQYNSDSKALFTTVPKKTGYVFTGWLGSDGNTYQPGTTYNGSTGLKLTAQWQEGKSTVTFDPNDGTVDPETREVCVDSTYGDLPTPARDYYTFLGWYTAQTGGSKVTSSTTVTKTEDHTLYAHWMNKAAYVKFDPNGGSPSSSVTMNAGKKLGDILGFNTNPTRTNYTFAGWYTEKDGGTQVTGNTIISDSVTYYAHWTGTPSTVTLKYSDSTTADKTLNVNYGGTYSNLPAPARTNYTFDGWYTAESGGSRVTNSTTVTETTAHTLYARWTRNVANIRFMDGESTVASRTVNAGDELGTLPQPAKTGYTFAGWYTAATGGEKVNVDTVVTAGANYYAHWTAKTYTVIFDKNDGTAGGSSSETRDLEYGSDYTLPEAPERTGYTFLGWFTAASGGTKVTAGTAVSRAENHTLYAQWERVVYTVTFRNGSTTVETRKINAGEKLGTLPAATKTGYTFKGWYTGENGENKVNNTDTISTDATYYAQWTANQYTITFNPNGGTVTDGTKTLEYGNKLTLPADPTRTGYTFAGWYTAATGGSKATENTTFMTAADTTYYARWTADKYTVTFDASGGTLSGSSSASVAYGSTYGTLPTATKNNQNFVGWYTAANSGTQVTSTTIMTATSNQTLYARYVDKHTHAVAPNGTAVEFDEVLTADFIASCNGNSTYSGIRYLPGGNYYLTDNITTEYCVKAAKNATVNICFNGYTITSTKNWSTPNYAMGPENGATLSICDCHGGGGLTQTANHTYLLQASYGTLNLYGGTFTAKNTGVHLGAEGSLLVDGATINAGGIGVEAGYSKSAVTIKSGTVTSSGNYAIKATDGAVTINGGTVSRTDKSDGGAALYAGSSSNVTINGGTVTSNTGNTVSCETPNFTVTGGTITNTGKWQRVISATSDKAHITLSGSPSIGRILVDSDTGKITANKNLTGTYQISLNSSENVTEDTPVTLTIGSDQDNTARFVLKGNADECALRDIVVDGKHTVQIYRTHTHNGVEWDYTVLTSSTATLENGKKYILAENMTSNLTVPSGVTADLCLNGKTLTGKITVNGTLNLYDCKNGDGITNSSGSVIVVNGTLNYYGGKLIGGSDDSVPIYADGDVNLYATPIVSTNCDYEIRGNSPGFLHICKTLTTTPSKELRVNFGTGNANVNITDNKEVTVTSGWSAYMSGYTPADYFASRAKRIAKIDTNEDGELVLRLLRVTIDGRTYYPAYKGGAIAALSAQPTKTGYIWQGYYTAESGGEKKEIGTSTVFTDDMTLYSQWKECDHSENTNDKTTTAATCTTAGSEKYTCSVCGLAVETVIDKLGHSYSDTWTVDTERGTHYHNCTTCSARVDEAEHTWETDTTTNATCTTDGSVKYSCTVCSATKTETIPALGHDYSDDWLNDNTNHWHKCNRNGCNGTTTAEAHSWGAWVVTKAAEVDVKGVETSTCEVCGKTKTQEIGALPAPEPTKYTVTYQKDKYTGGSVPTQVATAKNEKFNLPDSGLSRTGYTLAGWALLDENGVAGNNTLTGEFTMPECDVTFVVRWTRLGSCDLKSGDTIVLEENSVIERSSDGKTVTINQGGTGTVDTTITLPNDSGSVTVTNSENKDVIIVPDGSTVRTGTTTVTISGGSGCVEITGAVNAPAGSSVIDGNGNQITINSSSGRIDTDGTVSFSESKGKVSVKDKSGNTTSIDVPAGGEGMTVTENGTPLVDNGDDGVTIVSADGTTTTITLPESADAGIDETNNGVSVPAGSTITTTKGNMTTTTTISEGTGNVAPDGKVTLPDGGKVTIKDSEGKETTSTVEEGGSVDLAHTHSWSVAWSGNGTHHWHDCTADSCPVKVTSEKNGYAEHIYDQEMATDEYLKSAATCTAKATYYKSCICGAKGTETFESGEPIPHTPAEAVQENEVDATCTTAGSYDEVVYCSVCNKELSRETKTVNALGHDEVMHAEKNPTCTEIGWNAYVTCSRCDYTTYAEISAKGHTYGTLIGKVEATCIKTGMEEHYKCSECSAYFDESKTAKTREALTIKKDDDSHEAAAPTWTTTGTTHEQKWSCCGKVIVSSETHEWDNGACSECGYECPHSGVTDDGNCTTAVVCGVCGKTTVAAETSHTWNTWTSNSTGTHTRSCTNDGCNVTETENCSGGTATCREKAKCSICGEEYGDLADHEYGDLIAEVPATHMNNGTKAHYTCSVCRENFAENKEKLADLTIGKLDGHIYGEWTVTEGKGATCTAAGEETRSCICGAKETREIKATGHKLTETEAQAATCTEEGNSTYYTCSGCGKYFSDAKGENEIAKDSWIIKAGHNWDEEFTIDKAASCTEKGSKSRHCSNCNAKSEVTEIPATGHSYGGWITDKEATEHEEGSKHRICSVCDNMEEGTIPKLTHTHAFDKKVVEEEYIVSEATCTSPAVYCKSCECGEKGTETFEYGSALDHSYKWQHDAEKHWKQCIRCDAKDAEENHIYDDESDAACNTCGYERSATPVEHTHTLTKIDPVPASCTGEGTKEHWECSGCGKLFADENGQTEITTAAVPAAGHNWDAGTVTTAPTTSSEGVKTYTCTACGATKTEAIAKLPSGGGSSGGGSSGGGSITLPSGDNNGNVVNKAENKTTGAAATTTATIKPSTATTTTNGNKTTTATVDNTTATKIIEKAISNKSAEVVVDTATAKTVTETAAGSATEIALPEKTVQELSEKTEASVTIKSDVAEVTLNKAAVDGLAAQAGDDGYVKLVVETVKQEPKLQEVELKLVTSKGVVTDFKGGDVSITVKLNSALATKELTCVYIGDGGIYHKVNGTKNTDGTYTFITGHFSSYAIMALEEADEVISEQTAKVKALASKIQIKARSVKTKKGNIKVTLKITKGAASFKALEDMGYTLKYQFYRSTKMRKDYKYKFETLSKPYTNTDAKKGTRYYYKARIVVYDEEGNLITKTDLRKCWYATRIR